MSDRVNEKLYTESHQTNEPPGGNSEISHSTIEAHEVASKPHQTYLNFIDDAQKHPHPNLDEVKAYLKDAYLGIEPLPLSLENIAKSYAFYKGCTHKQTLKKILSEQKIALNLIPGLKKLSEQENFNLGRLLDYVCLNENYDDIEQLEQKAQIIQQKAHLYIDEVFQNPSIVKNALKAVSKKQWSQLLVKPPTNPHLLKATANLSSEEFFKNGMHLAFLEIEPEVYGSIEPAFQNDIRVGFKAKKHLHLLLEIDILLKKLYDKNLSEKRLKDDAKLYRGSSKEEFILENEVRKTTPKDHELHITQEEQKPSFIQKMIREELGYSASVDRQQVQKILEAAEDILNAPKTAEPPSDFLHKKHPKKQKPVITLDSIDLSTR